MMKGKKRNFVVYDIQSAVDCDIKLICLIIVTQTLTVHYKLLKIVDKVTIFSACKSCVHKNNCFTDK